MTTWKAKKKISRILRYYVAAPKQYGGRLGVALALQNERIAEELKAFISEFKGRKREKLIEYANDVMTSKGRRTK